jgi:hypothetical protein
MTSILLVTPSPRTLEDLSTCFAMKIAESFMARSRESNICKPKGR